MKKTIIRTLTVALVAALIFGVRTWMTETQANKKIDELAGVWTCMEVDSESASQLFEQMDFAEEELALTSDLSLTFVKVAEFKADRTYRFAYDGELTRQQTVALFDQALDALYEGRATLTALYGDEIAYATEEEFRQFYAEIYGLTSAEPLAEMMADAAFDYELLGEDFETGTYTVEGKKILCTITGETEAEYLGYQLDGDTLTLTYVDMEEVYTRAQ